MSDYLISCESTADMPLSFFRERNVGFVCFHYEMNGQTYTDDIYQSTTPQEFFGKLKAGAQARTSQVGTGEYVDFWEPYLKQGLDILHVALSTGISGTYNSACLAADELAPKYPERKIRVIDSLCASLGQGLLVDYAVRMKEAGKSMEETAQWVQDHLQNICHLFTVDDLKYLQRGGRISKTTALLGTMIGIKPVLHVDEEGKLVPLSKVRGRKQSIQALVDKMEQNIGSYRSQKQR